MGLESLGGNMPAGRPAAIWAGGRTQVFAIGADGFMKQWTWSGASWVGPAPMPFVPGVGPAAAYPCAITMPDGSAHLLAIGQGHQLLRWRAANGASWAPPAIESTWPIPAGPNGPAATSSAPNQLDVFAVAQNMGVVRYAWNAAGQSLGTFPVATGPRPASVLAAASPAAGVVDLFVVGPNDSPERWHAANLANNLWQMSPLASPPGAPLHVHSGFAAMTPAPGQTEAFAITTDGRLINWSFDQSAPRVAQLPAAPWPLPDGVPVVVLNNGRLEVFAIGHAPNLMTGGPLVRWRRVASGWSEPIVIEANLAAGGVGASVGGGAIDVFALNAGTNNSLQHWPAGVAGWGHDLWVNWAGSQHVNPAGHCRPVTLEEVVAIVKSAEKQPGGRVRAVGSSWSFSDIARTTPTGYAVETNGLYRLIDHVIDASVLTAHAPAARYLVHVEAGIVVENLMTILDAKKLAPFTLGGASGQTLAGVVSTSVHGSDWDRGPIPNAVRAIHLVGPGGVQHWIEPDQWRITEEAALRARLGPDVQIHYDDRWFDAALVSVGALGVIYAYVLEVTDEHDLIETCVRRQWGPGPQNAPSPGVRAVMADRTAFTDGTRFLQLAFDPADVRTCYVMTRVQAPRGPKVGTPSPDFLGAYCQLDVLTIVIMAAEASGVLLVLMATAVATAVGGFPPLAPAAPVLLAAAGSAATLLPVLGGLLRAGPPGTLGDFVGWALNGNPALAATVASELTKMILAEGSPRTRDIAHRVMAPANPGECAARGLSLEIAFDTANDAHLMFLDEALPALDDMKSRGQILGGWLSVRFVGPSRAMLSPQQSARTCMIEAAALRSLASTVPILDMLEKLGTKHGGIQHWGMFSVPNLDASALARAYPRLEDWKRVRWDMTAGGTIHTFDNDFTTRLRLDAAPGAASIGWQNNWRWCQKCLVMSFGGGSGPCPAGGAHDHGTWDYGFAHESPAAPGERNWHWCGNCQGLTHATGGRCPASGRGHAHGASTYTVLRNGQDEWRACVKCACLTFSGGAPSKHCPAGGLHDVTGSANYWLPFTRTGEPGQSGWQLCARCQSLTFPGGICAGGHQAHEHSGNPYTLAYNAPTAPGQAHWRWCRKCANLSIGPGVCFAGGTHDHAGSGDYTIAVNAGQNAWRSCRSCQGLWYAGIPGNGGVCPAGGSHQPGDDDYVIAHG